jgi:hypothetical protein
LVGILFAVVVVELSGQTMHSVFAEFRSGDKAPIADGTDARRRIALGIVDDVQGSLHVHSFPQTDPGC